MKYIKKYEKYEIIANPGDIVKCINAVSSSLTKNKIYSIFDVKIDNNHGIYYKLKEMLEKYPDHSYRDNRFLMATPDEIKQYKLEKTADKYNL